MSVRFTTPTITAYQVPKYNEDPGEDMIEWLNTCPNDWSGDDSGISFDQGGDEFFLAAPGDWIVCAQDHWFAISNRDLCILATVVSHTMPLADNYGVKMGIVGMTDPQEIAEQAARILK